jgi:hypothetical protein
LIGRRENAKSQGELERSLILPQNDYEAIERIVRLMLEIFDF